jgi:tetratricopeptide (TPR) repeat protein
MAKSSRPKLVNKKKKAPPQQAKKNKLAARPVKKPQKPPKLSAKGVKPAKPSTLKSLKPAPSKKPASLAAERAKSGKSQAFQPKAALEAKPPVRRVVPVRSQKHILIKQYEAAVKLVYSQDFEKAKAALDKIVQTPTIDRDVVERARSLLKICQQKLTPSNSAVKTSEDHYNIAVALMNQGQYKEAQERLQKALKSNPKNEFILYGLAATNCQLGHLPEALEQLKTAIELRPENRYLARNDPDFEALTPDPRFVALVFPERKMSST